MPFQLELICFLFFFLAYGVCCRSLFATNFRNSWYCVMFFCFLCRNYDAAVDCHQAVVINNFTFAATLLGEQNLWRRKVFSTHKKKEKVKKFNISDYYFEKENNPDFLFANVCACMCRKAIYIFLQAVSVVRGFRNCV